MIRSDCRGLGLKIPAPNRSMSNREAPVAIISIAQQAKPKVMGQSADFLAQLKMKSTVVVTMFFSNRSSIQAGKINLPLQNLGPVEGAFLDDPDVSNDQDAEEHDHLEKAKKRELPVNDGPGEQENGIHIKNHEENSNDV